MPSDIVARSYNKCSDWCSPSTRWARRRLLYSWRTSNGCKATSSTEKTSPDLHVPVQRHYFLNIYCYNVWRSKISWLPLLFRWRRLYCGCFGENLSWHSVLLSALFPSRSNSCVYTKNCNIRKYQVTNKIDNKLSTYSRIFYAPRIHFSYLYNLCKLSLLQIVSMSGIFPHSLVSVVAPSVQLCEFEFCVQTMK